MPKTNNEPKVNRPVHDVRIGLIKAAVWANQTDEGIRHNVTFERSYKDGEEWRTTASFGRDDLLAVAKAADQAHSWILLQRPEKKPDSSNLRRNRMPSAPA